MDPKIGSQEFRTSSFNAKKRIAGKLNFDKQRYECSTPTSTPIILSQSQDTTTTSVSENDSFNKHLQKLRTEISVNLNRAREIQIMRDTCNKYKYFCQQIAGYSKTTNWSPEKLPTPFGNVTVRYIHNSRSVDKFICGGKYSSYKEILDVLDNSKHSNEIAKSMLKYLESLAIDNFIDLSNLQVNQYNSSELGKEELTCAKVLSAMLMISEPSQNRNYCGGALERALLRYIVEHKCKFSDVINETFYPQIKKGGAIIARTMMNISDELAAHFSPQGLDLKDNANNESLISPPSARDGSTQ